VIDSEPTKLLELVEVAVRVVRGRSSKSASWSDVWSELDLGSTGDSPGVRLGRVALPLQSTPVAPQSEGLQLRAIAAGA
jgi:hypothetical protein